MRGRLLTRQDIAVSVPAQHVNAGQSLQKLKHLNGSRTEQDKVPERPPAVHPEAVRVRQDRTQRSVIPVDVGHNSQLHERSLAFDPGNKRYKSYFGWRA